MAFQLQWHSLLPKIGDGSVCCLGAGPSTENGHNASIVQPKLILTSTSATAFHWDRRTSHFRTKQAVSQMTRLAAGVLWAFTENQADTSDEKGVESREDRVTKSS